MPSRTSLSLSRMASSEGITLASTCPHPVNAWRRFWLLSGGHLMLLCRGGIVISSLFCPSTHTTLPLHLTLSAPISSQIRSRSSILHGPHIRLYASVQYDFVMHTNAAWTPRNYFHASVMWGSSWQSSATRVSRAPLFMPRVRSPVARIP